MSEEIKERARHKAFAKISFIKLKNNELKSKIDFLKNRDGRLSVDLLKTCLRSNERELLTWQYIAKLIEIDE